MTHPVPPYAAPTYPALVATHAGIWIDGAAVSRAQAIRRAADTPHLLLGAAVTASRLGYPELSGLDLLELFAFVHPARFAVPTANGLAAALGLTPPADGAAEPAFLRDAADALLATLGDPAWRERHGAWQIAQTLGRLRWSWGAEVARRIAPPERPERSVFTKLPKWEEAAPRPRPRDVAISDDAVDARLDAMLGIGAERRDGQRAYARAAAHAFRPRSMATAPNVALLEAGTGIGKTLGYLAPAAHWAADRGRDRLAVDLYQGVAAPARPRDGARLPRSGHEGREGRRPQGPRELPVPPQPRGCGPGRFFGPRGDLRAARRALGRIQPRRRPDRRRPARVARHPVRPRRGRIAE